MKKIAITCALLSSLVASSVWADAASDLKSRLDKVSSFHASFTQKVTDGSGAAVQEGQGDLWVKGQRGDWSAVATTETYPRANSS